MKLYTEEQVNRILFYISPLNENYKKIGEVIEVLTPIEIPDNDEDAGKITLYISSIRDEKEAVFFAAGAMKYNEWIKSQILNQNK